MQTAPKPLSEDRPRPGRVLASITTTRTREKGFIFAADADTAEEYFVHVSGVLAMDWPELQSGDIVTGAVVDTTKGPRLYLVRRATEEEQVARAAEMEDSRGNR